MKKQITSIAAKAMPALILAIICFTANAQKLPNVQQSSVPAPGNIKIDGKATEWDNHFEAYNHATNIYYTIANDANNVYLVVQATDPHIVEKMLSGGITFTIKNADKSSKAIPVNITYLFVPVVERLSMINKINSRNDDTPYNQDDLNKQFAADAKEIQVAGVKEIPDSLISVYNDLGIQAVARFDSKKAFTYELSIPLKYIQQGIGNNASFNYNVKLNPTRITPQPGGGRGIVVGVSSMRMGSRAADDMQDLLSTTDFSGTYTLAK